MVNNLLMQYIVKVACPNFRVGRDGYKPIAYVIHRPEGDLPGVTEYLAEASTQKSYHFIVAKDGRVIELVDPENEAWSCGVVVAPTWKSIMKDVNPNLYTINISLEGFADEPVTQIQLASTYKLIADLENTYKCGINEDTIVFHRDIQTQKTCPGFNVDKETMIVGVGLAQDLYNTAMNAKGATA